MTVYAIAASEEQRFFWVQVFAPNQPAKPLEVAHGLMSLAKTDLILGKHLH